MFTQENNNNFELLIEGEARSNNFKITGAGYALYGATDEHRYKCNWTGRQLQFYVDNQYVGVLSDKRLKNDIGEIDDKFLDAIDELQMKQFKIVNRNGLISFGILAQDLIETFKKHKINAEDYEILGIVQYNTEDETEYYTINYEQFLVLKQKATDRKVQKQQETIDNLIKRIEILEKEVNNGQN